MSEYVVRIVGRLNPPLTTDYGEFTEQLPSFSVTVEKEKVSAVPHANIQLEAMVARKQLQHEISPILTVIGGEEGRAISLVVTDVIYSNFGTATHSTATRLVLRKAVPSINEMHQKVHWATADPIYRDLLDLYTEAQAAPNPRPVGYKIVERLEKKFGNRNKACSALSIHNLKPIVANQSQYEGDRHAEYNVGDTPARLSPDERDQVLALLKLIIDEYEKRVCTLLP